MQLLNVDFYTLSKTKVLALQPNIDQTNYRKFTTLK